MTGERASPAERVYLALVAEYRSAILNYIYRMVGDADVAEDLTQETYVKAYRGLGRLERAPAAEGRRRAWLYRIAHNTATDHLRRKARLRWLPLEAVRRHGATDQTTDVDEAEPVRQVLAGLEDGHRQVLVLFSYAQMSAPEVGEVLGITPAAARKRLQRAREAFAARYEALGEGPG